jgi:hypothetical protein
MTRTTRIALLALTAMASLSLGACAHEVGSDGWCANLRDKPKGDWSASEATNYARYCLFK